MKININSVKFKTDVILNNLYPEQLMLSSHKLNVIKSDVLAIYCLEFFSDEPSGTTSQYCT